MLTFCTGQGKFISKPVQLPQVVLDMLGVRTDRLEAVRKEIRKRRLKGGLPPRPETADWPTGTLKSRGGGRERPPSRIADCINLAIPVGQAGDSGAG